MALTLAAGTMVVASAGPAAAAQTGANGTKTCPGAQAPAFFTLGQDVPCVFTFTNTGTLDASVTSMTEQVPFNGPGDPSNGPFTPIPSCTTPSNTTVTPGGILSPGTPCSGTLLVHIPNDPTLCNTVLTDLAQIALSYPGTGTPGHPLTAFAGATGTVAVTCPPKITVTKTATPLSKPTDSVDYSVKVCNTGLIPVTKQSVIDTMFGDISSQFTDLSVGQCETANMSRVVQAADPNPLTNTVTAKYSSLDAEGNTLVDTESASAHTDLFYPAIQVDKTCGPAQAEVGQNELCSITVKNVSTGTTPPVLVPDSIQDSLTGDLLTPGNPAVLSSTCNVPTVAGGPGCTITTIRKILVTDPNPLTNTVVVHTHPQGFPNDIHGQDSAQIEIVTPGISLTANATPLSKPTDPATFTVKLCNTGNESVSQGSVTSDLFGDVSGSFPATLAAGQCDTESFTHVVTTSDPNPLTATFVASYNGIVTTVTATAPAHTDLFFPSLSVSKDCGPSPIEVGQNEVCNIKVTNTSTGTTPPALNPAGINDSQNGDLLSPVNLAVVSSNCNVPIATGNSCNIVTSRTVLASDPSPLVNVVGVLYHPDGFPNNITGTASARVLIAHPSIKIVADATPLSKPTDVVTYHVQVCNTGDVSVTRNSVVGTGLFGDETSLFDSSLAPGACTAVVTLTHTVTSSDPNPLQVTWNATYSGAVANDAVATPVTVATDLFFPSVKVTKACSPNPLVVGTPEVCTIGVTNTSTGTTPPALVNGTINDSLSGNLLAAGNPAVTSNTCTPTLATGASCSISTSRVVLASDPNPLVNTVSVHYNPLGFPNSIDSQASVSLPIQVVVTQQCTLGFWKVPQHAWAWLPLIQGPPGGTLWTKYFTALSTQNQGQYKGVTNPTLEDALNASGGGINDFMRHAAAELLNSIGLQHPDETTAQVVAEVNGVIAQFKATGNVSLLTALAAKYDAQQQADNCTGFVNKPPKP